MTSLVRIAHEHHVRILTSRFPFVAWIRKAEVDIPLELYNTVKGEHAEGCIDLLVNLFLEGPHLPGILGVAAEILNTGNDKIPCSIFYYVAGEMTSGQRLVSDVFADRIYHETERHVAPPLWLLPNNEIPEPEETNEEEEIMDGGS